MMNTIRSSDVVCDNIGTKLAPTWRARNRGPLTPRAVRQEIVTAAMEQPESERAGWIDVRLTPLDRILTDDEARALEGYCLCEMICMGSARCADYAGDRVQTSRSDMSVLSDDWLTRLAAHAAAKARLGGPERNVLAVFVRQYVGEDGAPSAAEAALVLGLRGQDRRASWWEAVKDAAAVLAG